MYHFYRGDRVKFFELWSNEERQYLQRIHENLDLFSIGEIASENYYEALGIIRETIPASSIQT